MSLVSRIQQLFPKVTAKQVHSAWAAMSEDFWKKDKMQLPSAKALLEEHQDDVDIFHVGVDDGVEQLCWGMKKIATKLDIKTNVVEVALDATCTSMLSLNFLQLVLLTSQQQMKQTQNILNSIA